MRLNLYKIGLQKIIVSLVGILFSVVNLQAMECSNAQVISPQTPVQLDFAGETFSGQPQCSGPGAQPDMWVRSTVTYSNMSISVTPSGNFDPAMELYSSCTGQLLLCVNSAGPGAVETYSGTNLPVGMQVFVRIYNANAAAATNSVVNVEVNVEPAVALLPAYCGLTNLTTNSIIRASRPAGYGITNFKFRFQEATAPFNVYEVVSPNGNNPNFRMDWFPQVEYGRAYNVRVSASLDNGNSWTPYAAGCNIKLQNQVPAVRMRPVPAGTTFDFCDILEATPLNGADSYRWVFDDLNNPPITAYGEGNSRFLRLQYVPGLELGSIYVVRVYVTVNGQESPNGPSSFLVMNSDVPNTGLNTDLFPCGQTYPLNTDVQAYEICSASSFTWRFRNISQPQPDLIYTRTGGNRAIRLEWVPGLIVGDTYEVSVKATQGGQAGDYSSVCPITIDSINGGSGAGMQAETLALRTADAEVVEFKAGPDSQVALQLYPNPSKNQEVRLQIINGNSILNESPSQVKLFDMQGRLVYQTEMAEGQTETTLQISSLPVGIYNLRVVSEAGVSYTKLLIE